MILECPKCSARYKVDPALIPAQGKKVRCKKCDSIFKADSAGLCQLLEGGAPVGAGQPTQQPPTPKAESSKAREGQAQATQMLGAAATVMIDSAHIQAMVAQQRSTTAPPPAPAADPFGELDLTPKRKQIVEVELPVSPSMEMEEPDWGQDLGLGTVQMQTAKPGASSFATQGMRVVQPAADPQPASSKKNESPMYSELDQFHFGLPQKPLSNPASEKGADLDSLSFAQESEEEHASNTLMAGVSLQIPPAQAELPEPLGFAEIESDGPAPPAKAAPVAAGATIPASAPLRCFEARIDRQLYPALTLEVIERWVREGRLLESDELRPEGSGDFQRADRFAEVSALFQRYFGKTAHPPAKKKGFFARLFGR